MQNPLVSIIIPFKNTEDYILSCFTSILEQSYFNFEVVAVNDHSTDTSAEIVHSITTQDTRCKLFDAKKSGIISALQLGYSKASGTLITRMDSDDIMTPHKLQVMVDALIQHGTGHIAIGQVQYFAKNGINEGYANYEKWLNSLTEKGTNYSDIYVECVIPSPCWMVYKTDFDRCDGFNLTTYPEDYDLAFRFYEHGLKCIPCSEVLHLWRDYSNRTSRTSEHYAENYFLNLKLFYFLKLDHQSDKKLVIWGAGKKGKKIAQLLIEKKVKFDWVCDNNKKIGKHIYNVEMQSYETIHSTKLSQIIVTVANKKEQKNIKTYLQKEQKIANTDYFFFC
ncbi:glycosyltransferase family 2 protein [Cellulophaga sp. Hel_I_12]|uniref:glycosyltransferase family 2 protein n=1 Tax=Cellulophaga sp. Hel_I_12 TaxID=1249972 RepID=UPI000646A7CD|nr:glycosyltransferase family 2 protein [Cellulophaga sp. Hel_I_12]